MKTKADDTLPLDEHAQQHPAESTQLAKAEPSVPQMLQAFIEKGITGENMAAFERLMAMRERMEDREAEKQFAAAFVQLQADMPAVQAVQPVPNRDGTVRYMFAPYEQIMHEVRPVLQKNGFTVTFSSDIKDGRVVQTCTLQHVGGHKRENKFAARIGSGPPGSSEAQGDGSASTYAKRFALCDALNIVISHADNDARTDGAPISFEKAAYLRERVKETNSNESAFLRFAGASSYEEIGEDRYPALIELLKKKETPPK